MRKIEDLKTRKYTTAKTSKAPKEIDINYIKSGGYRTFHVDGVFGGLTPNGKIHVALFVQRQVIPEIIKQEIMPEGALGQEVSRVSKKGIVREIESGLIMDVEIAKIFRDWLDDKIKEFEKALLTKSETKG
jgi:hypothetical protein